MPNDTVIKLIQPGTFNDQLTDVLRDGARALLAQAVEAEVADFLGTHAELKTADGHRRVVRHGHLPEREVMTGIGPVAVRQPRVRDREAGAADPERIRFTPAILPPYARRSKSLEMVDSDPLPEGHLDGRLQRSAGGLLGEDAHGLSRPRRSRGSRRSGDGDKSGTTRSLRQAVRLPVGRRRPLQHPPGRRRAMHPGPDGRHADGKKELIAIVDGNVRASRSWRELALGREGTRPGDRSEAGHRRRSVGLLEGARPKSFPRRASNAAGSTRRPTSWTSCPRACSAKAKRRSMRSGWPRRARMPTQAFDSFLATYGAKYAGW